MLKLNVPSLVSYRRMWIAILELSRTRDPVLYRRILGFPDDLPDLSTLQPPGGNARPEGIGESHFQRRLRGELPDTY